MWRGMKISGLMMLTLTAVPSINERFHVLEAIEKGLIYVESIGIMGQLGAELELKIHSTKSNKVDVVIPAGTHFVSKDESEQDIFVVTNHHAVIVGHAIVKVEGCCSQLSNRSHQKGSLFQ
jgi:hypothetical protein